MNRTLIVALFLVFVGFACQRDEPRGTAAQPGTRVQVDRLSFELPSGWERANPSSPMRVAQATIPGPAGAAEMAVFFFGAGQGGGVDANITRWLSQMDTDPGTIPDRSTFEANGLTVNVIDAVGTLRPSGMGIGPKTALPDQRLIGAVVEGAGGPWFFKATGPKATLGAERDRFLAMLHNLQPR
jgi:hypothetical protein